MLPPLPQFLTIKALMLIHRHFYLQDKLYRLRCKSYKNSITKMDELIDILIEVSKKQKFQFTFSKTNIQWNLLADNDHAIRISAKDSFTVSEISMQSQLYENFTIEEGLVELVRQMIQSTDRSLSTFPDSELQEEFDHIFNNPRFIFSQEFQELCDASKLSSPKHFVTKTINLMNRVLKHLQLRTHDEVFIFSIAFFRVVFAKTFPSNPSFFKNINETQFRNIDSKLTLQNIGAPLNLLPDAQPTDHPRVTAQKIPEILEAAKILSAASFMTSPLDVLLVIHNTLLLLKKYAAAVSDADTSSAFESIFGLFMLTLAVSDLPSPQDTFAFAIDFTPATGLSGVLEYDKATATAAKIQTDALIIQYS
ncbi:hypothetical protein TVAG_490190 [Trichomonas vaginalis G3]|uniref:Uncharacterized protein n=1 Tax=Trichomonas vaginalis (strain ATCC PRA-98 / G3) TaxID=412133 RepID=A2F0V6_TRIV3|nr:hypothetical protein TVAGG3_0532890 [Trichomonas vaginalis G3]EAY01431.1 hypothetical protein TVAG_490190 [Trichomonas vaginalis G3]KAI5519282.1 hypothetical protein TVAGG3_0532890 [Trichomonas vaginalis G3]|eukprot:XP_001314135.1 hypothetical protein [Trichomonas vaginalis G3]